MPEIFNQYHGDSDRFDHATYIGRGTIFGNPYTHLKTDTSATVVVGSREEAITAYKIYFTQRIENDPTFKDAVETLRGRDLLCWCAPLPCHGDVILDYLGRT